jgi:hypothetical protein
MGALFKAENRPYASFARGPSSLRQVLEPIRNARLPARSCGLRTLDNVFGRAHRDPLFVPASLGTFCWQLSSRASTNLSQLWNHWFFGFANERTRPVAKPFEEAIPKACVSFPSQMHLHQIDVHTGPRPARLRGERCA